MRSHFLWIFTIILFLHKSCVLFLSHIVLTCVRVASRSAFSISFVMLSASPDFPLFKYLNAFPISSSVMCPLSFSLINETLSSGGIDLLLGLLVHAYSRPPQYVIFLRSCFSASILPSLSFGIFTCSFCHCISSILHHALLSSCNVHPLSAEPYRSEGLLLSCFITLPTFVFHQ